MGMPAWAMGLGAFLKAPEIGNSILDFARNINAFRDESNTSDAINALDKFTTSDQVRSHQPDGYMSPGNRLALQKLRGDRLNELQTQEAVPVLEKFASDYASIAGPNKRFLADPESRAVLQEEGLLIPANSANPMVRKGLQDFTKQAQVESDIADSFANPGDVNALSRLGANPTAQAQHNILATLQLAQDKAQTREMDQAKADREAGNRQNISAFQSAISGLTAPSTSPGDLQRFAKRGGYAPFSDVEGDIRQAAASYNVGDSPEVNKAVTDAREMYKNTMLPPQTVQVGRTTATGQSNLLGDFRKDVASVAPVVNNHTTMYANAGPDAVAAWTDRIAAGQSTMSEVPRQTKDAVMADLGRRYPGVDLSKLKANQKYQQAPGNLQSRALIQGIEPLYDRLLDAGKALGNSSIPGVNSVKNWVKEHTGNPEITAFNNLRDDVIAESERVLVGSGVLSDKKYLRAVKNVSSAASMPQLQAAVKQLRLTVHSRLEALDKKPFPDPERGQADQRNIAPAGLRARLPDGRIVISDGKGGWGLPEGRGGKTGNGGRFQILSVEE